MCRKVLIVMSLMFAVSASASVVSDLQNGMSMSEAARQAKAGGSSAADVVKDMIAAGQSPASVAVAVAGVWNDCDATVEVAQAAAEVRPASAAAIALSLVNSASACRAESLWGRSRVESRMRPDFERLLVPVVSNQCAATAMAVEGAVKGSVNTATNILNSVLENNCGCAEAAVAGAFMAVSNQPGLSTLLQDNYDSSMSCSSSVKSLAGNYSGSSFTEVQFSSASMMMPVRAPQSSDKGRVGGFGGEIASPN
ncbi:MAG: hypothetical protein ACWA5R_06070 [bacterium]